ncbi:unnamed protein product [Clonostachys chloroleuca]|uniref:Uncharacterized protein n=1 Tax=Clonostachys chloroleuca TaxID=1926264 RepID=A0AA35VPX6_9HYPO|nr:unnamed protein product [Clonostachys chloroleuca]
MVGADLHVNLLVGMVTALLDTESDVYVYVPCLALVPIHHDSATAPRDHAGGAFTMNLPGSIQHVNAW